MTERTLDLAGRLAAAVPACELRYLPGPGARAQLEGVLAWTP